MCTYFRNSSKLKHQIDNEVLVLVCRRQRSILATKHDKVLRPISKPFHISRIQASMLGSKLSLEKLDREEAQWSAKVKTLKSSYTKQCINIYFGNWVLWWQPQDNNGLLYYHIQDYPWFSVTTLNLLARGDSAFAAQILCTHFTRHSWEYRLGPLSYKWNLPSPLQVTFTKPIQIDRCLLCYVCYAL